MEKWQDSSGKFALRLCATELLQTAIRQEEQLHNKTQNELIPPLRNELLSSTFSSLLKMAFSAFCWQKELFQFILKLTSVRDFFLRYYRLRRLLCIDIHFMYDTQREYA